MKRVLGFVLSLTLLLVVQPAFAQTKQEMQDLQKEITSLKEGQIALGKDIQEIKKLIQGIQIPPAPQPRPEPPVFKEANIDIKGAPIKGDNAAKLVLVEFSDYECPACLGFARSTQPQILKDYVDTGKIRMVFMDFPLSYHKKAAKAAEAGQCAQDQGKFWEMNEKLFADQESTRLDPEKMLKIASELGLDGTAFKTCLDSGNHAADVKKRMDEGRKAMLTGTPSFYLGFITPEGTVKATKRVPGGAVAATIDEMLTAK